MYIKFCYKSGIKCSNALETLILFLVSLWWVKEVFKTWLPTTLKKWKKWLWMITESQLEESLLMEYQMAHVKKFFSNVLGTKRVSAKFVSKMLNFDYK